MEITGTFTPTRADWARGLQQAARPVVLRVLVLTGTITALGLAGFVYYSTGGWLVVAALGAALCANILRLGPNNTRRFTGAALGPHTYTVGEHGIRIRTEAALTEIAWPGIERLDRLPDVWVLRPASRQPPLVIFRGAFDDAQNAALSNLAHQRGLVKT